MTLPCTPPPPPCRPRPQHRRAAGCVLVALGALAMLAGGAARAEDEELPVTGPGLLSVRLSDQPVLRPLDAVPGSHGFATATQSMAWLSRGRFEVGMGVQRPWTAPAHALPPPDSALPRNDTLVLGVSLRTGAQQRLVWQTEAAPASSRLSLQAARPYRSLVRGALRMELSRDTALSFKPRANRFGVTLTSRW